MRFLFLFAVLMMVLPVSVQAQGLDLRKVNQIARFDTLDEATFEKESFVHEERPEGLALLAYDIRLPASWVANPTEAEMQRLKEAVFDSATGTTEDEKEKQEEEEYEEYEDRYALADLKKDWDDEAEEGDDYKPTIGTQWLGSIARYFGPVVLGEYSKIEVFAQAMEEDISARNWFLRYVRENGFSLEGVEVIGGDRVEGLYIEVKDGVTYAVRVLVETNGPYIVLVLYHMPVRFWKDQKALQEKVINSFHFKTAKKEKVSTAIEYSFAGFARFDYPESWELGRSDIRTQSDMEVHLLNKDDMGALNAEITVRLLGRNAGFSLPEEVEALRNRIKKDGLEVNDMIESMDPATYFETDKTIKVIGAETYSVRGRVSRMAEYEYWVTIALDKDYFYIVTMLSVGRNLDFYEWALNSEAFERVVETLRP